jgi:hypothetical protein
MESGSIAFDSLSQAVSDYQFEECSNSFWLYLHSDMSNQLRNVDAQLVIRAQSAHNLSLKRKLEGNIDFTQKLIKSRYAVPALGQESINHFQKTVEGLAHIAAITAIRLENDINIFEGIAIRFTKRPASSTRLSQIYKGL